jgi:hypothetical protein
MSVKALCDRAGITWAMDIDGRCKRTEAKTQDALRGITSHPFSRAWQSRPRGLERACLVVSAAILRRSIDASHLETWLEIMVQKKHYAPPQPVKVVVIVSHPRGAARTLKTKLA